jgi:hypothetical protein
MMPLLTGIGAFALYMISPFSSSLFLHVLAVNDHVHLVNAKSSLPLSHYTVMEIFRLLTVSFIEKTPKSMYLERGVLLFSTHSCTFSVVLELRVTSQPPFFSSLTTSSGYFQPSIEPITFLPQPMRTSVHMEPK